MEGVSERWSLASSLMRLCSAALAALLWCALAAAQTPAGQIAQKYRVANVTLQPFGTPRSALRYSLTNNGRVIVWGVGGSIPAQTTVYDDGVLTRVIPAYLGSLAFANDAGQSVFTAPGIFDSPVLLDADGTVVPIPSTVGTHRQFVMSLDEDGTVLGRDGTDTYYLWSRSLGLRLLPVSDNQGLPTQYTWLRRGRVLGYTTFAGFPAQRVPFNYTEAGGFGPSPINVDEFPRFTNGTTVDMSNSFSPTSFSPTRAFRYINGVKAEAPLSSTSLAFQRLNDNGSMLLGSALIAFQQTWLAWLPNGTSFNPVFPDPSNVLRQQAIDMNSHGIVIGTAFNTQTGVVSAYAWTAQSGAVDLNARLDPSTTLSFPLNSVQSINDRGEILASSGSNLYLLIPDDAPAPVAPAVGQITGPEVIAINTPVTLTATFTDINQSDTHVAQWSWEDGSSSAGTVTESAGTGQASGTHAFTQAGVYNVNVQVTDNTQRTGASARNIVVYDPSAGFVTGGGWYWSPPGALTASPMVSDRANFNFVSKYKKGATTPSGDTEFIFQAGNISFISSQYEWLVVGGNKAQYKGMGTLNGLAGHKFMLTAIDGGTKGTDRFRIRIWHRDAAANADVVDYDNQVDSALEGTAQEGTEVRGGNIVVH